MGRFDERDDDNQQGYRYEPSLYSSKGLLSDDDLGYSRTSNKNPHIYHLKYIHGGYDEIEGWNIECRILPNKRINENGYALVFIVPKQAPVSSLIYPMWAQPDMPENDMIDATEYLAVPLDGNIMKLIQLFGAPIGFAFYLYQNRFMYFEFPKRKNGDE